MKAFCTSICIILFLNCNSSQCDVLKNIILNSEINSYLHTNRPERKTLYVVKNSFCEMNETIGSLKVVTVDYNTAKKRKNYLRITSHKNFETYKQLSIDYPMEGAVFNVKLDSNNQVTDVVILEK